MTRFLEWLTARYMFRCEHRDEHGLTTLEPYFYGRVLGNEDILVTLEVCSECGAVVAQHS